MGTIRKLFTAASLTCVCVSSAFAASDGSIGSTSTGTSDLDLVIPEQIIVRGMDDVDFGTWSPGNAEDENFDISIAGNDNTSPTYQATLTGSGAASAFTITDGTNTIAYTVQFNDATGTGGAAATSGTPLTAQTGIHGSLATATDNANIRLQITNAAMQAAPAGTYAGVLTIVVAPEP